VYEMKDYLDWTERKGVSGLNQLLRRLCYLLPCSDVH